MKWFWMLGVYVHLLGCSRHIPESEVFWREVTASYEEDVNDCSNKAARYLDSLHEKGYSEAFILEIRKKNSDDIHAIVGVPMIMYLDPTSGKYTYDLSAWGAYFNRPNDSRIKYHWEYKR